MKFIYDDGGRNASGFKGHAGDCVCRAIAIVTGRPYKEVYDALAQGTGTQRATARTGKRSRSARNGINVRRKWFKDYAASIDLAWTPTMQIGSGCKVHLHDGELPPGRLVVAVSGHYTAVIDGVIRDTHDPQRETLHYVDGKVDHVSRRCVYGYYRLDREPVVGSGEVELTEEAITAKLREPNCVVECPDHGFGERLWIRIRAARNEVDGPFRGLHVQEHGGLGGWYTPTRARWRLRREGEKPIA